MLRDDSVRIGRCFCALIRAAATADAQVRVYSNEFISVAAP